MLMSLRLFHLIFLAILAIGCSLQTWASDLRILLPKRTRPTPVQALNQEGVREVRKHHLEKAEKLFYRAYLIDPDDPFTLNNLGYISELEGKVERAQRYYQLAARQNSETTIDRASEDELQGRQLTEFTGAFGNREVKINRGNIEAMSLMQQGRVQEAEVVLQRTLTIDPRNPFTLNNLGYAMEAEGNLEKAFQYYSQAANLHSSQKIVVAPDRRWRGKAISDVAAGNVKAVRHRLDTEESTEEKVARLNLQGVSAINHNDPKAARQYFYEAYKLDPRNAFTLNNMGYIAELDGDQETAQDLYEQARVASGAARRATLTTRREMQGQPLGQIARSNDEGSQANLEALRESRLRQGGPIELKTRDNRPVVEPPTPPKASPSTQQPAQPSSTVQPQALGAQPPTAAPDPTPAAGPPQDQPQ
jgi:Flp pilus assembly protein TadD